MQELFQRLVQICLLRLGPQDLPALPILLLVTIPAQVIIGVLAFSLDVPLTLALPHSLLGSLVLALYTLAAVWLQGHRERFVQSLAALTGTDAITTMVAIPFLWIGPQAALLTLLILLWQIAVMVHIFRQTLESWLLAALSSVTYIALWWWLSNRFFPLPETTT